MHYNLLGIHLGVIYFILTKTLLPFALEISDKLKNEPRIQEAIEWHLARLDAVKQTLIFPKVLLSLVCDFVAPETRLKAWKNKTETSCT